MKKIFLDANVIIDYLNIDSKDHSVARLCLQIVRTYYAKPVVSPFTVLIANFLAGKFIKDKKGHRLQMQTVFSAFEITPVKSSAVLDVFESSFLDLEDGLQYQCALSAKANAIITKDVHDYFPSKILVVHPHDFVNRYKNLFS
jgi:predicted nucleic acid-binding protein